MKRVNSSIYKSVNSRLHVCYKSNFIMDFSSGPKGFGGNSADVDRQLAAVKQQLDLEFMTRKLQKITDKCFQKCITKPGSSLDNSQQKCLAYCMDRYADTEKLVSQTLVTRLQQES